MLLFSKTKTEQQPKVAVLSLFPSNLIPLPCGKATRRMGLSLPQCEGWLNLLHDLVRHWPFPWQTAGPYTPWRRIAAVATLRGTHALAVL